MRPCTKIPTFLGFTALVLCAWVATTAVADGPFEGQISTAAQAALTSRDAGVPTTGHNWMVATANPVAADAGADILRAGGTAADAMIAVQAVLGLLEPQSSGLGGGAFLVWFDATSGQITTLDGRETAPLNVTPQLFQDVNGEPLRFWDAVVGGRSVGTPGTPLLLEEAHKRWGKSNWASLFDRATDLAQNGFTVSPRLADSVAADPERLSRFPATKAYFFPNNVAIQAGDTLKNQAYAQTLRALATNGAHGFYTGAIAQNIVKTVQTAPNNPGALSLSDLAIYQVKEREPICSPYNGYQVCGMGPPSSGALTVGQILALLEPYTLSDMSPDDPQTWRLIGDASRLAFADRGRYMADADFVPIPTKGLLEPAYIIERSKHLSGSTALETVAPGSPKFDHALNFADDEALELPSTSHISIIDSYGNALSMTTTVENRFGSRLMSGGFILNNELTDFSFRTHRNGAPIANRVEPGKRPRSSMSPTIVLKEGKVALVIGSPGGSRIIGFTAQTIIAHLDWGMNIQAAISMPRLVNRFGTYDIETPAANLAPKLQALGYKVTVSNIASGLHGIAVGPELTGGADPRREGIALGE